METILELNGISKKFQNQMVNRKISMNVKKGSIYGLLGPNGAGKSTLLKIITGMLNADEGNILFDEEQMTRKDLSSIGALIENAPIYENLTARENLKVRALLYGLPDSRMDEVLNIVGLTGVEKKKTKAFSMGMKQRLGIAMALLNHPKLLILDEPTNGLDPLGINELRELIRSLPQKGITVIISSHILTEIEQVADYIGILVNGKLLYEQPKKEKEDLEGLFFDIVKREGHANV